MYIACGSVTPVHRNIRVTDHNDPVHSVTSGLWVLACGKSVDFSAPFLSSYEWYDKYDKQEEDFGGGGGGIDNDIKPYFGIIIK